MAARRSYASDRRQSGGYRVSMQYGSRQAYMYGNASYRSRNMNREEENHLQNQQNVNM